MKILDTPSQVLNAPSHVTNTPSQCRRHQLRQPKQQIRPTNLSCFVEMQFLSHLRTFLVYNLQDKKCGVVQKMINTRYASEVLEPLSTEATTVSIEAATYSIAL